MTKRAKSFARKDYGYNSLATGHAKKPRSSIRKALNQSRELVRPNGVFDHRAKFYGFAFVILMMAGVGVFVADQALKTPGHASPLLGLDPDQITPIWTSDGAAGDLSEWNVVNAVTYQSGTLWTGSKVLRLADSGNGDNIYALAKSPFDPSPVSSKHFLFTVYWKATTVTSIPDAKRWVIYLTTNGTISSFLNYSPFTDKSVALIMSSESATGGTTYNDYVFIQRDPTESISQEDYGSCSTISSCFLTEPQGNYAPAVNIIQSSFWLNYTGSAGPSTQTPKCPNPQGTAATTGLGCSFLLVEKAGVITATTGGTNQNVPPFKFQGQKYYVGVWMDGNIHATFDFALNAGSGMTSISDPHGVGTAQQFSMMAGTSVLTSTLATVAPDIPTGGWFGGIFSAFGNILSVAVRVIFSFLNYIYQGMIAGFDIIGNFLGIGAIGTAFSTLIGSLAGFITNVLGGLVSTFVNVTTATGQIVTLFTSGVGNYFTALTGWFAALASLFGTIWTVIGQLLSFTAWNFNVLAIAWWCWGMLEASFSFPSWMNWARQTLSITMFFFRGLWWLTNTAWAAILGAKSLLHPTASGGGGAPPP